MEKKKRSRPLAKDRTSRAFQLRSGTMMSLQRTSSEAVTSAMTSDAFKVNGDATDGQRGWGWQDGWGMAWVLFTQKMPKNEEK